MYIVLFIDGFGEELLEEELIFVVFLGVGLEDSEAIYYYVLDLLEQLFIICRDTVLEQFRVFFDALLHDCFGYLQRTSF